MFFISENIQHVDFLKSCIFNMGEIPWIHNWQRETSILPISFKPRKLTVFRLVTLISSTKPRNTEATDKWLYNQKLTQIKTKLSSCTQNSSNLEKENQVSSAESLGKWVTWQLYLLHPPLVYFILSPPTQHHCSYLFRFICAKAQCWNEVTIV